MSLNDYKQRNPTYLITGGAGFIGSHLAEALLAKGCRVLVIDNLSTGSLENIRHLLDRPDFHFAYSDIANEMVLDRLASEADVIVHLAAAVGVKLVVENPVHTIQTNIMGTEKVLETAHRYQAKVVIASTSEVYGKGHSIPFREDDDVVLGPTSRNRWGYAASKMVDEFLALAYYHEKGLPVAIARLFNTVGPRQTGRYGMVIPRFVQQALRGEPLTVYGDGQQSRCFLHVEDAVRALIGLAESPEAIGEVFNVGSQQEISILDLAQQIIDRVGTQGDDRRSEIEVIPYGQAYAPGFEDMQRRFPDISKIEQYLGWKPTRSLDEILEDAIESFQTQNTVVIA
ncbi:GDP-mannose 4,6-dehydratase [Phormidium sp. CCY1219]|uniref:GDP-mannose 4,6-dehydratase n=1 Tax=Phormidium sp. CCY1219 TaxID=2886104 RepID=UPI002D1E954E|nr:GDP-mannose 4,6-dehydratase [Phormidium sp. CCY1219]MEB3830084.1 GDP-mannose 4,6-dehydratase [Phormidium sp. CCY1219]